MAGMTGFFQVLSPAEFIDRLRTFPPVAAEAVGLPQACGRVLAQEVISAEDLPPCDRSSMDGYAVRARDVFGASESNPAYLELMAELRIDAVPDFELPLGHCAAVVTGGCLPRGGDSVVMVEHTQDMGAGTIELRRSAAPGDNVMLRGEDVRRGETALPAGRLLRPQEIGLLAALGVTEVQARRRPRAAIISTGDELVPPEATPRPGQIRDVNTLTLAGLMAAAGAEPVLYGLLSDDLAAISDILRRAVAECDAVFISGGSSVGIRDLTLAAIESLPGAEVLAHGVAVSPGKPTILAKVGTSADAKAVVGLPGQVTSAQVVMHVFGLPFLGHLAGDGAAFSRRRPSVAAVLARNVASKPGREDYVRVRLEDNAPGLPKAHPILGKSGLLRTLLDADGLVRIPADREGLAAGTEVQVTLL